MKRGVTSNGLLVSAVLSGCQPTTQQPVDRPLEGIAGAPNFLLDQHGNIVVNGKSGSHIMMLS